MKASLLTSIKAKIISLMLLGIAGMVISTATNTFFDHQKNRNIEIGRYSQQISQIILESMMLEELFIGNSDNELLPRIAALDEEMNQTLEAIKTASEVPEILKAADDIATLNRGHDEMFHTTSAKLTLFNQIQEKFKNTDDQLIEALQMVINRINAKETALLIDDEYLPSEEKLMREKMKDFIAFDSGKTVNILNLFIFADVETYQKRSLAFAKQQDKMIEELTNILGLAKSDYLNQAWSKIYGLIKNNREQEKLLFETWSAKQKLLGELKSNGSRIQVAATRIVNLTKENIEQSKRSSNMIVTAISLLGLAAMIFVGVMIIIAIVKPINTTVNMLKDIAEGEGDLTSRLESKNRDEIAELAHWFNLFIGKVQTIINEVAAQVSQLNSSAAQLSQLATGMSAGAEQVLSKANNVAAAAEEMSGNTGNIAGTTGQAAENVNLSATAIQEMTTVINEIAGNTAKARAITFESVNQTNNANRQVSELGAAAQEIGKVIESISSISSQVNLLALNATIEAARAGEAGKGFAVVANEIKELAQQTAAAADEIQERVEGIQHSTGGTVKEIEAVTLKVNEVNEIVSTIAAAIEEQSTTTREIAEKIVGVSENLSEVNDNINQSSTVAAEIAAEIAEVTGATRELTDNSTQVKQQSSDLTQLAAQLDKIVRQFKI